MKPMLALCAAVLIAVGAASPALARPTHRCVARAPGGCPNQHPPIVHGQAVVFHGPPIIGVQSGHRHKGKPKVTGITVTKQTNPASPGLFRAAQ